MRVSVVEGEEGRTVCVRVVRRRKLGKTEIVEWKPGLGKEINK